MKPHRIPGSTRGNTLVIMVFVSAAVCLVLVASLSMVSQRTRANARSQAWNSCIALAEAGVEEAMAHLNKNAVNNDPGKIIFTIDLASEGWQVISNLYYMRRAVGDSYYEVWMLFGARPVITSTGYVPLYGAQNRQAGPVIAAAAMPWETGMTFASRTVQARARAVGRFTKGVVAKSKVELVGVFVDVDSYHSYDPNGSTWNGALTNWGTYDINERRDAGDVAVLNGFEEVLKIEKATVRGRLSTGPDGDIRTNKTALVGSLDWCDTHTKGVQPGWTANDASFNLPDVTLPYAHQSVPQPTANVWVTNQWGTNHYDWVVGNGDYWLKELKGSVLIAGTARLLVKDKIEFSEDPKDNHGIDFDDGAKLELYSDVGGGIKIVGKKDKKKHTSVMMTLNGSGNATNFFLYGTHRCTKIEVKNMDDFTGVIYAPNAEINIKAGSLKYYHCHFFGAAMGKKVKLEKNVSFHYDENLANLAADSYVVEAWTEL